MSVDTWTALGTFAAVVVALVVAWVGRHEALETRRAMVRDREADLLVQLIEVVETDRQATEHPVKTPGVTVLWGTTSRVVRSSRGMALCRALWGRRNLFGTTWHVYCEDDHEWTERLFASGDLYPRMRDELQSALDSLNHEDAKP